jgi:hypothetical protein
VGDGAFFVTGEGLEPVLGDGRLTVLGIFLLLDGVQPRSNFQVRNQLGNSDRRAEELGDLLGVELPALEQVVVRQSINQVLSTALDSFPVPLAHRLEVQHHFSSQVLPHTAQNQPSGLNSSDPVSNI